MRRREQREYSRRFGLWPWWSALFCVVLQTLSAGVVTVTKNVSLSIPDGQLSGVLTSIDVADVPVGSGVQDLNVELTIDGTLGFNGDLYVYLAKADNSGFSVLLNRPGRSASDLFGSSGSGLNRLVFDDEATNGDIHLYEDVVGESAIFGLPWSGSWQPDGRLVHPALIDGTEARTHLLNQFDGLDPNGKWLLFIADVSEGGISSLVSWTLEFDIEASVDSFAGVASDGLVAGGTVFFDANLNGVLDATEPWVLTDGDGDYALNVLPGPFDQNGDNQLSAFEGVLVITGGSDIATGLPLENRFSAPLGATVIHPLTTLIAKCLIADPNLTAAAAEAQLESALGLDAALAARVDLLTFDMFAEAANGNADAVPIINAVAKVQDTVVQVSDFVSGVNGVNRAPVVELAFDQLLTDLNAGKSLALTSAARIREVIDGVDGALFNSLNDAQMDAAAEVVAAGNVLKQSFAESSDTVAVRVKKITQAQVQAQSEIAGELRAAGLGQLSFDDLIFKNTFSSLEASVQVAPVGDLQGTLEDVGTFSFDMAAYEVGENGLALHPITIVRESGNAGTVQLLVTPSAGTADSSDFVSNPIEVDFGPLEIRKTLDVAALIQNDTLEEGLESFSLRVNLRPGFPQGAQIGTQSVTTVSIIDDDSFGLVSFADQTFEIREDGTVITPLSLVRQNGSGGVFPVVVTLSGLSDGATAGDDFVGGEFLATFNDGNLNQRIDIATVDDNFYEGDEELEATMQLSPSADAAAQLGALTTVRVLIREDDPNHAPTITAISDQTVEPNTSRDLDFVITDGDADVQLDEMGLAFVSSNESAVPASALSLLGTGSNRTLRVLAPDSATGTSTISITASEPDGGLETTFSFDLTIATVTSYEFTGQVFFHGDPNRPIPGTSFDLYFDGALNQTIAGNGNGAFSFNANESSAVILRPWRTGFSNPSSGVDVLDILLLRRDIIALERFDSALKVIAGDCNRDGRLTVTDIIAMRELILGRKTAYSSTNGEDDNLWRFVPSDQAFADARNPFQELDAGDGIERRFIADVNGAVSGWNLTGIKLGDVDLSWQGSVVAADSAIKASVNQGERGRTSDRNEIELVVGDSHRDEQGLIIVPVLTGQAIDSLLAVQLGLSWDPANLKFQAIASPSMNGFEPELHSFVQAGGMRLVWEDPSLLGRSVSPGEVLFKLAFASVSGESVVSSLFIDPGISRNRIIGEDVFDLPLAVGALVDPSGQLRIGGSGTGLVSGLTSGQEFLIAFPTSPGITYAVQRATDLAQNGWVEIGRRRGTGSPKIIFDQALPNQSALYRVVLEREAANAVPEF